MFWLFTFSSSFLTAYMLRSGPAAPADTLSRSATHHERRRFARRGQPPSHSTKRTAKFTRAKCRAVSRGLRTARDVRPVGNFLRLAVDALGRPASGAVRSAAAQILRLRTDALSAGFLLAHLAPGHRGVVALFLYRAGGRLWCGYACPQTVWTEAFVWMERLTEGSRLQQIKLDQAPWGAGKLARKASKQLLWVSFALFTGVTFVGYFSSIEGLFARLAGGGGALSFWEGFWILFLRVRDLWERRLSARTSLQIHVSVRALPERDVRPRHPDRLLRCGAWRAARLARPPCAARRRPSAIASTA